MPKLAIGCATLLPLLLAGCLEYEPELVSAEANSGSAGSEALYVVARAQLKPGTDQQFFRAVRKLAPEIRAEDGNRFYYPHQPVAGGAVVIYEAFADEAALAKHLDTDHVAKFQ